MSRPKAASRKRGKTKDAGTNDRPRPTDGLCCQKIRETAYYKWEAAGSPCCDGVEFWLLAETELAVEAQPRDEASKA